jgi:hypothetical protein
MNSKDAYMIKIALNLGGRARALAASAKKKADLAALSPKARGMREAMAGNKSYADVKAAPPVAASVKPAAHSPKNIQPTLNKDTAKNVTKTPEVTNRALTTTTSNTPVTPGNSGSFARRWPRYLAAGALGVGGGMYLSGKKKEQPQQASTSIPA